MPTPLWPPGAVGSEVLDPKLAPVIPVVGSTIENLGSGVDGAWSVTGSADDAEEFTDGEVMIDEEGLRASAADELVGIRFTNITIPAGSNIRSAHLDVSLVNTDKNDANHQVHCEAADSGATFVAGAAGAATISIRARTTAFALWSQVDVGVANDPISSPDLAVPIGEVIARSGWTSGNSLVVIVVALGGADLQMAAWDHASLPAPALNIQWDPPPPVEIPFEAIVPTMAPMIPPP